MLAANITTCLAVSQLSTTSTSYHSTTQQHVRTTWPVVSKLASSDCIAAGCLCVLQVSEANIARAAAEARQLELERSNNQLRLEVTASQHAARSTMEEAVRLLSE